MTDANDKTPSKVIPGIVTALFIASIVALATSFFSIRDTVRDHTLRLDSLIKFRDAGRRFTWGDGVDLQRQIDQCKEKLNGDKSREHYRINVLEKRLDRMEQNSR